MSATRAMLAGLLWGVGLALMVLWVGTSHGATRLDWPRTPVQRMRSADLSWAVKQKYPSQPCRWSVSGTINNQLRRAAIAEALTYVALPRIILFARQVCPAILGAIYSSSGLSGITAKLDPIYEAGAMRQGEWHEIDQCRDYVIPWNLEKKVRDCVTSGNAATVCAAQITPTVADYLDVRVQNGRCVEGSGIVVRDPQEPYRSDYANESGLLVTDRPIAPPDAQERAALDAATAAHLTSTGVDAAQQAFEALADDEREHRFFRLGEFLGTCDPGWTPAECTRWDHATHTAYLAWAASVKAADPFGAEQDKIDHNLAHICKNVGADDRLMIRPTCPAGRGFAGDMNKCPAMTCRYYLTRFP